jgi:hypothetical protein
VYCLITQDISVLLNYLRYQCTALLLVHHLNLLLNPILLLISTTLLPYTLPIHILASYLTSLLTPTSKAFGQDAEILGLLISYVVREMVTPLLVHASKSIH